MINTCSPNKGLLRTIVILYYHRKRQAALLSQIYSHGTDRKENNLWTVSNKACIVVPCLVVTQERSLLPLTKETATVYRVYSCMKNSTEMHLNLIKINIAKLGLIVTQLRTLYWKVPIFFFKDEQERGEGDERKEIRSDRNMWLNFVLLNSVLWILHYNLLSRFNKNWTLLMSVHIKSGCLWQQSSTTNINNKVAWDKLAWAVKHFWLVFGRCLVRISAGTLATLI
jgi:hypothetical protein